MDILRSRMNARGGRGKGIRQKVKYSSPHRCPFHEAAVLTGSVETRVSSLFGINKQNSITLVCDMLSVFLVSPQSKSLHAEKNAPSACVFTFQLPLFLLCPPCLQHVGKIILFQEKKYVLSV